MKQSQIYFQAQGKYSNLCLVHAINNLLGNSVATQQDLDQVCKQLSSNFFNPHKHFLGGDYDANVLMLALQNLGYYTKWLDNRNEEAIYLDSLILKEERVGYILNKPYETNWFKKSLGMSDRHWIALKCIDGLYYELDSKKEVNQKRIIDKISEYLQNEIKSGSHIIEVLTENRQARKD